MGVSEKDKLIFTKNLSVMMKSDIPLLEAVRAQTVQVQNLFFKHVLVRIARDVESGHRLSLALARHPSVFPLFYVNVVKAGETAGSLDQNLDYLASQIEERIAFGKTLSSSLMYPAILLTAVCIVGLLFAYFILPNLTDLLASFQTQPPPATRVILFISFTISHFGAFIFLGIIALGAALVLFFQSRSGKPIYDKIILHLPVMGKIFTQVQLVELSTVFSTLLKSGVPVHESLQITAESIRNSVYQKELARIIPAVLKGNPVSMFLDRKLFPPLFMQLLEVGEKSARIEQNLDFLANFYRKEVEHSMSNILTLLEPILLIIVGVAVLFLALAVIGPIYQIAGS